MRQLTYVRPNLLEWWDVRAPRLQDDGDAIVQPLAVTRCDLDLYIANGAANFPGPFAIGHEAAGVVAEVGDSVARIKPGDQVIVPFQISCGKCDRCRRGRTNACTSVPFRASYGLKPVCGVEFGGALSDFLRVPFADHMLIHHPQGHQGSDHQGRFSARGNRIERFSIGARHRGGALQSRVRAQGVVIATGTFRPGVPAGRNVL